PPRGRAVHRGPGGYPGRSRAVGAVQRSRGLDARPYLARVDRGEYRSETERSEAMKKVAKKKTIKKVPQEVQSLRTLFDAAACLAENRLRLLDVSRSQ